jgi:acetyltransferase-like isoleucine patch superfamily enzyme
MPLRHRIWRYLLALPGSIFFCLRHLPLRQAVHLPILVAHTVARPRTDGSVRIEGPIRPGMIKIGFGWAPLFDWRRSRGVWTVTGEVVFEGAALVSHGAKLSVEGKLVLGDDVRINAEACILCEREISIGARSWISWHTMIMDTDSHSISGGDPAEAISIGEHVLVGAGATILKGVHLPDGAIVAASSCVTRSIRAAERDVVAGNPARVVRSDATWADR